MKTYLAGIIQEQIHRGIKLKEIIPHPLIYPELNALAERCSGIIDSNVQQLEYLLDELQGREEADTRDIFRYYRSFSEQIKLVEYFGISPLFHQNEEIGYLTKLVYKIHREIHMPISPPVVACYATDYYHFDSFTNVILVPIGESFFLLHLPDLFHEMGHEVLWNSQNEPKLTKIFKCYKAALDCVTAHYKDVLATKKRESGPQEILRVIALIHSKWKSWIVEFFCDIFALFTLGPAFAWSHLHLTTKYAKTIYQFSHIQLKTHPSDDARMKLLLKGLEALGFNDEVKQILAKWQSLPVSIKTKPVSEYQYAYPDKLLDDICSIFLDGIRATGFNILAPEKLNKLDYGSVILLLNQSWDKFWINPVEFRDWEQKAVNDLKTKILPKE